VSLVHGSQLLDFNPCANRPTMYYGYGSGVHVAIEQTRHPNQRVGIVGLGTGSLAAYGRGGDIYRFYEINPQVVRLSTTGVFTYLTDSPARVEVSLGDARLVLEREQPQDYDLLVLDAFSSDTIPAHLLTSRGHEDLPPARTPGRYDSFSRLEQGAATQSGCRCAGGGLSAFSPRSGYWR